ncbi:hypothetical protein HPP92_000386 [Vanilla planifolia]|uniref:RING-type E3 ubiquitin transferase n=1 Tax=Vanilla planifolia TaxID=51239 RepID=A0A835RNQ8_VANPL|nr:hypothetical protein HPP92_000386 [Vanilla planifolia]
MGQSSSSRRRRQVYHQTYPPHAPLPPPPPPPAPPHNPYPSSSRPNFSNPYYNSPQPAPPPSYYYGYQPQPQPQQSSGYGGLMSFLESLVGNNSSYYRPNQGNVLWIPAAPGPPPPAATDYFFYSAASSSSPAPPPPPYVEHQQAKKIKNDVNVHKDTIRLESDELNPDQYLVSFVYDAEVDGSITIYYFAKEGENCSFHTTIEDIYKPRTYPFQKATGEKFCQPSGHGIDLGFFETDNLSKTGDGEIFPLVIYTESCRPMQTDGPSLHPTVTHAQITLAFIEKDSKEAFQVKVAKQILWIDGERYELKEIFGLSSSSSEPIVDGDDDGKECVICMTEPRDTAVFPCRHLCMCGNCAKAFRLQSNKCPICRQPVEKLLEINVQSSDK